MCCTVVPCYLSLTGQTTTILYKNCWHRQGRYGHGRTTFSDCELMRMRGEIRRAGLWGRVRTHGMLSSDDSRRWWLRCRRLVQLFVYWLCLGLLFQSVMFKICLTNLSNHAIIGFLRARSEKRRLWSEPSNLRDFIASSGFTTALV